jgi:hypothetical protein
MAVVCETLEITANTREDAGRKYAEFYEGGKCSEHAGRSIEEYCVTYSSDCFHTVEKIFPLEISGGFLGRLQTRNYEFTTYQKTVQETLTALKSIWESHATESGASYTWEFLQDSVTITPLQLGDTLTDCNQCENLAHN